MRRKIARRFQICLFAHIQHPVICYLTLSVLLCFYYIRLILLLLNVHVKRFIGIKIFSCKNFALPDREKSESANTSIVHIEIFDDFNLLCRLTVSVFYEKHRYKSKRDGYRCIIEQRFHTSRKFHDSARQNRR